MSVDQNGSAHDRLMRNHPWRPFLVALMFLTRVPVPRARRWSSSEFHAAQLGSHLWFPLVGTLIGFWTCGWLWIGSLLWPTFVLVTVAIVAEILLTGAFHEDALADFADAFGGGWDREQTLRILKDSRLGTYGTLAIALTVILRIACLASISSLELALAAVLFSTTFGRWAIVAVMRLVPAIPNHEGLARTVPRDVASGDLLIALGMCVPGCLPMLLVAPIRALIGVCLCGIVLWVMTRLIQQRLGGATGDCWGAVGMVSQLVILLAAVIEM